MRTLSSARRRAVEAGTLPRSGAAPLAMVVNVGPELRLVQINERVAGSLATIISALGTEDPDAG